ncbi:MAG: hypothetical protein KA054_00560 [Candidatus Moranbacteria bacterium]|nr:hypothetical protein [Candidatus Moranbacteria bacterium]
MPEELRPIGEISEVMVSVEGNPEQISTPQEREASSESPESEQGPEKTQESETNQLAEILNKAGTVLGTSGAVSSATDDARNLSLLADIESQVTRLLDLATQKGIPHAVHVAQKMKNYYLLDRMHDEMVDKFYQSLVEKGMMGKD